VSLFGPQSQPERLVTACLDLQRQRLTKTNQLNNCLAALRTNGTTSTTGTTETPAAAELQPASLADYSSKSLAFLRLDQAWLQQVTTDK
jgi:hypothetical protein